MKMTLRKFLEQASTIKEELLDKEIVIEAPNGMLFEPQIKFIKKDIANLAIDIDNVDKIIIVAE